MHSQMMLWNVQLGVKTRRLGQLGQDNVLLEVFGNVLSQTLGFEPDAREQAGLVAGSSVNPC
jgi:hypothetical protein